jgi:hypothetical protein
MNLYFLTETQEKELSENRYEYSKEDINDMGIISSNISSLIQAMIVFHIYKDSTSVKDCYCENDIYNILEMLIEPINTFFLSGAKVKPETEGETA